MNPENKAALEAWVRETGIRLVQVNGQRKYGGPPPGMLVPAPSPAGPPKAASTAPTRGAWGRGWAPPSGTPNYPLQAPPQADELLVRGSQAARPLEEGSLP